MRSEVEGIFSEAEPRKLSETSAKEARYGKHAGNPKSDDHRETYKFKTPDCPGWKHRKASIRSRKAASSDEEQNEATRANLDLPEFLRPFLLLHVGTRKLA